MSDNRKPNTPPVRWTAPKPFEILTANLRQGSDPSRGTAGNPQILRWGFRQQHLQRIDTDRAKKDPIVLIRSSMTGVRVTDGGTAPTNATGTVTIADNAFTIPVTLKIGPYKFTSGEDFAVGAVSGEAVVVAPPFNGVLTNFTATLAVTPITPGTVVITTSAGVGSENFTDPAAGGVLVGSGGGSGTVDYNTGAVTLVYFAAPAAGLTVSADYGAADVTATNLAAVIDAMPDLSATAAGAAITVTAPLGIEGDSYRFEVVNRGAVINITLNPTDGFLDGGNPVIGAVEIL